MKEEKNRPMHFIFRDSDNSPITEVWVSADRNDVRYKNYKYEDRPLRTVFGWNEHPTWQDVLDFFENRSYSRGRGDLKEVLHVLHMEKYDPEALVRHYQGRCSKDSCWIEFLEDL